MEILPARRRQLNLAINTLPRASWMDMRFPRHAEPTGIRHALGGMRQCSAKSDGGSAFWNSFLLSLRNHGIREAPSSDPLIFGVEAFQDLACDGLVGP